MKTCSTIIIDHLTTVQSKEAVIKAALSMIMLNISNTLIMIRVII